MLAFVASPGLFRRKGNRSVQLSNKEVMAGIRGSEVPMVMIFDFENGSVIAEFYYERHECRPFRYVLTQ